MLIIRLLQIIFYCIKYCLLYAIYKIIGKDYSFILPNFLQSLGPVYIKLGQVLSTRIDVFNSNTIKLLNKLKDNTKPINNKSIFAVFKKNFNTHINSNFNHVTLISSASIAQVYSGYLNNKKVAIKIIKPNVKQLIKIDLILLHFVFSIIEKYSKLAKNIKITKLINNLRHNVQYELDLRFEAGNLEETASKLKDIQHIFNNYVNTPNVYWQYVTSDTMVIDYINGYAINNIPELVNNNINLDNLSYDLLKLFLYQVLHDGYFHGDTHSGNILVTKNGSINLIDFGIMGKIDDKIKYYLFQLFTAFLKQDYKKAAQIHFDLGWVDENKYNIKDFTIACRIVMQDLLNKPQSQVNIGSFLQNLLKIATMFKMESQESVLTLQKNLIYIESIVKQLSPHVNVVNLSLQILEDLKTEINFFKENIVYSLTYNNSTKLLVKNYNLATNFLNSSIYKNNLINIGIKQIKYILWLILLLLLLNFVFFLHIYNIKIGFLNV